MRAFAATSTLLCLTLSGGCTTVPPEVITKTVVVKEKVPAALIKPCPPAYRKPITTTGGFVEQGDHNAAALATCSAQVDGIRAWDKEK